MGEQKSVWCVKACEESGWQHSRGSKQQRWKMETVLQFSSICLGLEHVVYEERVRHLDLLSLKRGRQRGHLFLLFSYPMGHYGEDRDRFFLEVHSDGTRGNRHNLGTGKSY